MATLFEEVTGRTGEDPNPDAKNIKYIDSVIREAHAKGETRCEVKYRTDQFPSKKVLRHYEKQGFLLQGGACYQRDLYNPMRWELLIYNVNVCGDGLMWYLTIDWSKK